MPDKEVIIPILDELTKEAELIRAVNTVYTKDGRIIGYAHIIYDVTKRKQDEQELERNKEFLTILMDTFTDSIYFKDDQNRYILVNKSEIWNKFLDKVKEKYPDYDLNSLNI